MSATPAESTPAPLRSPAYIYHDRVLAERIAKGPSPSGLFLPENVKDDQRFDVVVVAIGEGRITDQGVKLLPPCKVGDKILFIPGSGIPFTLHGHTYIALASYEVIGKVNDDVVNALEEEEKNKTSESFFAQTKKPFIAG